MEQTLMYAALLAHNGAGVSEATLINILEVSGITYTLSEIQKLVAALDFIDIEDAIKQPVIQPLPVIKQNPPKEEEKKVEVVEDEDLDLFKSLFG